MAVIKLYGSRYGSLALSTNQRNADVLKRDLSLLAISAVEKFGGEGAARLFALAMELHHFIKAEKPLGFTTVGEYTPEEGDGTVMLAEIDSQELAKRTEN